MPITPTLLNALMAGIIQTAPVTLFGVAVNEPLTVAECPAAVDAARWLATRPILRGSYYRPTVQEPCYRRADDRIGTGAAVENEVVFIHFPAGTRLDLASENQVNALVLHGRVQWLRFGTYGTSLQARDLQILTDKFGSPTTVEDVTLQNGFGATFLSVRASWSLAPGLTASYDSAGATLSRGLVTLATDEGRQNMDDRMASVLRGNRGL